MGCGIRNVSDHNQGCAEIFRMLKPGGQVLFLEPSMPTNAVAKAVYLGYFRHVVPTVAGLISIILHIVISATPSKVSSTEMILSRCWRVMGLKTAVTST